MYSTRARLVLPDPKRPNTHHGGITRLQLGCQCRIGQYVASKSLGGIARALHRNSENQAQKLLYK